MSSYYHKHGGNLQTEAREMGVNIDDIIDASASMVPFKIPLSLQEHLKEAISSCHLQAYPDRDHQLLREAISKYHKVTPEMVLPGNGASELFTWVARDASKYGISSLPSPGFADYSRALNCWDAPYIHSPLPLIYSQNTIQDFPIKPQAEVIWITNPHNPTGQLWKRASLEKLLKKYQFIICDEAFLPLVPNGDKQSLIPLIKKHPNLIIIRSLTKLFAIPGLRLGYAIGCSKRLKELSKIRDPWPLNGLAILAGIKIMSDVDKLSQWTNKIQNWVKEEGEWFYSELDKITGIMPLPSATNFLLIKSNFSLTFLLQKLRVNNILVRDCRSFIGLSDQYLRISLQKRNENQKIISAIKKILD